MSRSRTHGPETRILKAEVRRLKKQLRQYERMRSLLEERMEEDPEPILKLEKSKRGNCPSCDDGQLSLMDLGIVSYHICNSCSYRKKLKD